MTDLTGQDIGRYHIVEQLGQGGMATVYRAYDNRLEREVALKVIRREAVSSELLENMLRRFEREARALAKLEHSNIVKVHDYGEHEGSPYLVMQYLPGGTLKEKISQPMPYTAAAHLLHPIALALGYAHQRGVVHRDVKPANILITLEGAPMLSDFGIAKILEKQGLTQLTNTGVGIGTPEYMAPEQGMGKEVDHRADIYALGIVFFEMLTGQKPYRADTPMAVVIKHMTDPLPHPHQFMPDLPDEAVHIIFRSLAKDPADRFPDMIDFAAALENLITHKTAHAPAVETPTMTMQQPPVSKSPGSGAGPPSMVEPDKITSSPLTIHPPLKSKPQASVTAPSTSRPDTFPNAASSRRSKTALIAAAVLLGICSISFIAGSIWLSNTAFGKNILHPPPGGPTPEAAFGARISEVDGMEMVFVPAGPYEMGSDEGFPDEQPVHSVTLDAYWIDRTEVTNAMFADYMNAINYPRDAHEYFSEIIMANSEYTVKSDKYASHPVTGVDWFQAEAYCEWAGRRLPTEAEWEKAACGVDDRAYPWGDELPDKHTANSDQLLYNTAPVGSYPEGSSPCGALDMTGNAREWVADWYDPGYYPVSPAENPSGSSTGSERTQRGGDYYSSNNRSSCTFRDSAEPDWWGTSYGFRCALSEQVVDTN
jgi:eukaryotic-like serine/threonine-protein kinase